jgi:hypothetical protein
MAYTCTRVSPGTGFYRSSKARHSTLDRAFGSLLPSLRASPVQLLEALAPLRRSWPVWTVAMRHLPKLTKNVHLAREYVHLVDVPSVARVYGADVT